MSEHVVRGRIEASYGVLSTEYGVPRTKGRLNEKGVALILAMFSMLFVSMLVISLLNVGGIGQQIVTNHTYDVRATYIADAGIETGIYELRQDNTYTGTGGLVVFPAGSGSSYSVVVAGGSVLSTGIVGDYTRIVSADYTLTGASAPYTVVLDNWVEQ